MAQEIVDTVAEALKNKGFPVEKGEGMVKARKYLILVAEKHEGARITRYKGFRKTEMLRIRCSPVTKHAFYSFADKIGARTLEDALISLLEKVGFMKKIKAYVLE